MDMFKHYFTSKYFPLFIKTILVIMLLLLVYLINSSGPINREGLQTKNVIWNYQIVYAKFIENEYFDPNDTSSSFTNKGEKSDLFYYILGIIILISAGFILKQRYEQYLKRRDNL